MKLDDAITVLEGYISYTDERQKRSVQMQKLAAAVRRGDTSSEDAKRKLRQLQTYDNTVYDGSNLYEAVKLVLKPLKFAQKMDGIRYEEDPDYDEKVTREPYK